MDDWTLNALELIDTRSFTSLWFWIVLAVQWSVASHFGAGVPHDMVQRARRHGGQAADDLDTQARLSARRLLGYVGRSPALAAGVAGFVLASLGTLGFWVGIELAQAVFLLAAPMLPVALLTLRVARRVLALDLRGPDLWRELAWLRFMVQVTGALAIFGAGFWGMMRVLATHAVPQVCGPGC